MVAEDNPSSPSQSLVASGIEMTDTADQMDTRDQTSSDTTEAPTEVEREAATPQYSSGTSNTQMEVPAIETELDELTTLAEIRVQDLEEELHVPGAPANARDKQQQKTANYLFIVN